MVYQRVRPRWRDSSAAETRRRRAAVLLRLGAALPHICVLGIASAATAAILQLGFCGADGLTELRLLRLDELGRLLCGALHLGELSLELLDICGACVGMLLADLLEREGELQLLRLEQHALLRRTHRVGSLLKAGRELLPHDRDHLLRHYRRLLLVVTHLLDTRQNGVSHLLQLRAFRGQIVEAAVEPVLPLGCARPRRHRRPTNRPLRVRAVRSLHKLLRAIEEGMREGLRGRQPLVWVVAQQPLGEVDGICMGARREDTVPGKGLELGQVVGTA
mmetsp:Transcript_56385/g.129463  ORF Transcript_56385/g.129463 Transcript_56385/m.129463 type:complete len:276 (+) Transcript_56385:850-1677(+)